LVVKIVSFLSLYRLLMIWYMVSRTRSGDSRAELVEHEHVGLEDGREHLQLDDFEIGLYESWISLSSEPNS
jgi:hypothetical protein